MKPSDYDFANALTFAEAMQLEEALDSALSAMAHYGSDEEHMLLISALRILAVKDKCEAMKKDRIHRKGD